MRDALLFLRTFVRARWGMKFSSREKLEAHQRRQLARFERDVLSKSKFFRYARVSNLAAVPMMNKRVMMENFDELNTVGIRKADAFDVALTAERTRDFASEIGGIAVGLSSGTSGSRGLFLASKRERAQWAGVLLAKLLPAPLLQRQRVALFLRANSKLYESVGRAGLISFRFFDMVKTLDENLVELQTFNPSILVAPAQLLEKIARAQQAGRITLTPRKVISVAEVLPDDVKTLIEATWAVQAQQVYQCTEGFLAASCEHGKLHLNEEFVHIEPDWIDREGGRFAPVVTDFTRSSQPIVRYRLDDVLVLDPKPCSCGRVTRVIERIEGRCDDVLTLPGAGGAVDVFPDFVSRAIVSVPGVEDFRCRQSDAHTLRVQLLAPGIAISAVTASLRAALARLGVSTSEVRLDFEMVERFNESPLDKRRRTTRERFDTSPPTAPCE
ncbi:CoF synthetase [Paraburkholderia sp. UCT31]|uniref:F390 synthetase-related protein n=1 Tax=Paraburkholderia sp. UCT31 TaxID=2615209 RepID=UPI001655D39B|nr:F390 synthetase-related protein [Paraburkholderia sp. UCT31]MBC8742015.1 CoF synthetase [Paraburkholderia sp. UCT31]